MDNDEIRARLKARGLKQADVAKELGIAENKVSKSLKGVRRFQVDEMEKLRRLLEDNDTASARRIPLLGHVQAGAWREAVRNPIGSIPSPDPSVPPRAIALRVEGDSMDLFVEEGGTIIVDPDDKALFPGRFYVVENGEGETTFKRFRSDPARLEPCSSNDSHKPIMVGEEPFQVLARVIWRASKM